MSILTIQHLHKIYKNGITALDDISFNVTQGDFFALLGPNGAGKSTLIGIICSLINKTQGTVIVCGHNLDSVPQQVKRCIGLVPQEFNFNQFQSVQEILINQAGYYGIPYKKAQARTEQYLQQLELWNWRKLPARELSGGMKRRLMIARALVHQPQLLILDEPTAGVDIAIRRSIWQFLRQLNDSGTTVILTTHYLEEVENLCRNLAIINHGKIIKQASLNTMLNNLNTETFVLNLRHQLIKLPNLSNYVIQLIDDTTIEITINKQQSLNDLFNQLTNVGIEIASMRNKQNRLEQLLIDQLHHQLKIL
jgi:ABC-2 type transport system ATP-binding protein